MPFEIAPHKLSVAQQLAALIEAGRAANPHIKHGVGALLRDGKACAMGFALLAAGVDLAKPMNLAAVLGCSDDELMGLAGGVVTANDTGGASIEQIAEDLRAGAIKPSPMFMWNAPPPAFVFVEEFAPVKWISTPIKAVTPSASPSIKVRKNTKTGAMWPVAKHAYA